MGVRPMDRVLVAWLRAVGKHWKRELLGGALIGLLALVSELSGITIPPRVYEVASVFVLFYAMFLAWQDEYSARMKNDLTASELHDQMARLTTDSDLKIRELQLKEREVAAMESQLEEMAQARTEARLRQASDRAREFIRDWKAASQSKQISELKRDQQRRITKQQEDALIAAFHRDTQTHGILRFGIVHNMWNSEAAEYARQLASIFSQLGACGVPQSTDDSAVLRDMQGLAIQVKDQQSPPERASRLEAILSHADIRSRFESVTGYRASLFPADGMELVVGRKSEGA